MSITRLQGDLKKGKFGLDTEKVKYFADSAGNARWGWGTADPTDAKWAVGAIYNSAGTNKYNSGTAAVPVWTQLAGATSSTLDQVFDNGKIINGATTEANALVVGGATDNFTFWQEGANDIRIGTSAGANITIVPNGGTLALTGALTVSTTAVVTGNLTVGADKVVVTAATGAIATASSLTSTLAAGNAIVINTNKFVVAADTGNTTIAGDLAVTGSITGTFTGVWGGSTWTANPTITLSATTGVGLKVDGDTVTTGNILQLEGDASLSSGYFIACINVATTKFSVGSDGSVIIAGTSAGSDACTLTAGDVKLTSGHLSITDGDMVTAEGKLTVTSTADEQSFIKRTFAGAGTAAAVKLWDAHASATNDVLNIVSDGTGAADGIKIEMKGTGAAIQIRPNTATTGVGIDAQCVANTTTKMVNLDGSTADWVGASNVGLLHIACDGALAHANASLLYIAYSGAGAATGLGTSIRVVDTGSTATSNAVYMSAGTGGVLSLVGLGAVDTVTVTSAAAAASLFKGTCSAATGTGLELIAAASSTVAQVALTCTGTGATGWLGATGVGIIDITCDGNLAHANASCFIVKYSGTGAATGLGTCIRVVDTGATDTANAVYVSSATGGAMSIAGAGTVDTIAVTSAAAAASALKMTCSAATGTVLELISAASSTVGALTFANSGTGATGWLGATGVGMVTITGTGNLAHANASCLLIAYSGAGAATGLGTSLRITDTGSTATSYAAYISAATGEALFVDTGKAKFTESATFKASNVEYVGANFVQAGGGANAISATLTDADGANVALADGLRLLIDLVALTLQAGANTITFNGGAAKNIKSHYNIANNIGTAYAAGGFVEIVYDAGGDVWQDLSQ